ncbi:MAG TPA: HEPN domain-containing protein [Bacteroidales bacterium]|nr:HEPN domain-containing protein [Bacteroidales bacterium]
MNIENNDLNNLINYRLKQAEETILDVGLLIENNRLRSAVNRIYYGMFYSLLALGLAYNYETSRHSQLIGWFNKNFINNGLLDKKYGKILTKAYNRRTKGDYDIFVEYEKATVEEMYGEMKDFISTIKSLLKK